MAAGGIERGGGGEEGTEKCLTKNENEEKRENYKLLLFLVVPSLEIANKYTQGYVRNHII